LRRRCAGLTREEIVDVLRQEDPHSIAYYAWAEKTDLPGISIATTEYWRPGWGKPAVIAYLQDEVFVGKDLCEFLPSSWGMHYFIGFIRLYAYIVSLISAREESVEEPVEEPVETEEEATHTPVPTASGPEGVNDKIKNIKTLFDLYEQGALTANEFSEMKSEVIAAATI
jgi:hypothetical protein